MNALTGAYFFHFYSEHMSESDYSMDEEMIPLPPIQLDQDPDSPVKKIESGELVKQLAAFAAEIEDQEELISFIQDLLLVPFDHVDLLAALAPPGTADRLAFLQELPKQPKGKCRCDAQWYAKEDVEHVAFGCKTCALSSASCICVACFEAGDHEGHDFYISRSDYGCCDCGDLFAWKKSGFCKNHSGPDVSDDPQNRLSEWMQKISTSIVTAVGRSAVGILKESPAEEKSCCEMFSVLIKMSSLHDGLRRIVGRTIMKSDESLGNEWSIAESILPLSDSFSAATREIWTNLIVDQLLDLEFKSEFGLLFSKWYKSMVLDRLGKETADLGDFDCQIFTRPDVALRLVKERDFVQVILDTMRSIIQGTRVIYKPENVDVGPFHGISDPGEALLAAGETVLYLVDVNDVELAQLSNSLQEQIEHAEQRQRTESHEPNEAPEIRIIDHGHVRIRKHELTQPSIDLTYILDHRGVVDFILGDEKRLGNFWSAWIEIVTYAQFMNPHCRRTDLHVEFPDSNWSSPLTTVADLMVPFWITMAGVERITEKEKAKSVLIQLVAITEAALVSWTSQFLPDHDDPNIFSMHCPLNRVLGLLVLGLLNLCESSEEMRIQLRSLLHNGTVAYSLLTKPLEARWFQAQAALGMWRRNGDSVNNEIQFYKSGLFHHHLTSADMAIARLCMLRESSNLSDFFRKIGNIFGIYSENRNEFTEKMNGILGFISELLSQQCELSLDEKGLLAHRISSRLAIKDETFSQLRDPKTERWTHTLMPHHNQLLESVLPEVAKDESAPNYSLSDRQWLSLDLVSPFWSLKDSQTGEERLLSHLRDRKMSLSDWWKCNRTMQPVMKPIFMEDFEKSISSLEFPIHIFFALHYLLENRDDFRSLKSVIHIILRLNYPIGPQWAGNTCSNPPNSPPNIEGEISISSLREIFATHPCCHPWSCEIYINGKPFSIYSMLRDLGSSEQNSDMKNWIELVITEIGDQCVLIASPKETVAPSATPPSEVAEKRKLMQKKIMERLQKKQGAFLSEKKVEKRQSRNMAAALVECVICLSEQGDESGLKPSGTLAYITRGSVNLGGPRKFIPTNSALIPDSNISGNPFLPLSSHVGSSNLITRTCGHKLHLDCWAKLTNSHSNSMSVKGYVNCPYCNRPCNIVLSSHEITSETVHLTAMLLQDDIAAPSAALVLIGGIINQLTLSLRHPSPESDVPSLEKALTVLIEAVKQMMEERAYVRRMYQQSDRIIPRLIADEGLNNEAILDVLRGSLKKLVSASVLQIRSILTEQGIHDISQSDMHALVGLATKNWLCQAHIMWHYLVSKNHELPFEEILSMESALSLKDEIGLLASQLPTQVADILGDCYVLATEGDIPLIPLLCYTTSSTPIESESVGYLPQHFFESLLRREPKNQFRQFSIRHLRFFEHLPSIIPMLPSVFQKLYTSFLRSKCVRCQSVPKIPVLCLLCGAVLCCNAECCQHGVVGEVTHHYRSTCCPGGIGIFLQLSMSMVVLVSTERNRTVIAEWGSLYTDSHGEEDFGLSKPLMLNPDRVRKLVNELREQSWVWKGGSKELPWKFSTGII